MEQEHERTEAGAAIPEQAEPNRDAGQSEQDPTARTGESPVSGQTVPASEPGAAGVPAASEIWVEGQPTSEADYDDSAEKGQTSN
jgi:hypothetical protein